MPRGMNMSALFRRVALLTLEIAALNAWHSHEIPLRIARRRCRPLNFPIATWNLRTQSTCRVIL
jgi:hypothetical protein